MAKYRNEWKYICSPGDMQIIDQKLQGLMIRDTNADANGYYYIHSLYFDDYTDTCAFSNDNAYYDRFKYRIRFYNDNTDFIRLERKEKLFGRCRKLSCKLTAEEYQMLIDRDVIPFLYDETRPVLRQFSLDVLNKVFQPKVITDYNRVAYVEPITNVRVTFDTNITASFFDGSFLNGDYPHFPLQRNDYCVLEVKFDDILPGYLRESIETAKLQQTSFSKYYLGRKILEEILI